MNSSQDGRSPSIIIRLIGTLIGVSLLVYLLSRQGWTEIAAAIHQIPLATIVLACVLMLASRLAVSARWHALLRSSGAGISLSGATKLTFAGTTGRLLRVLVPYRAMRCFRAPARNRVARAP